MELAVDVAEKQNDNYVNSSNAKPQSFFNRKKFGFPVRTLFLTQPEPESPSDDMPAKISSEEEDDSDEDVLNNSFLEDNEKMKDRVDNENDTNKNNLYECPLLGVKQLDVTDQEDLLKNLTQLSLKPTEKKSEIDQKVLSTNTVQKNPHVTSASVSKNAIQCTPQISTMSIISDTPQTTLVPNFRDLVQKTPRVTMKPESRPVILETPQFSTVPEKPQVNIFSSAVMQTPHTNMVSIPNTLFQEVPYVNPVSVSKAPIQEIGPNKLTHPSKSSIQEVSPNNLVLSSTRPINKNQFLKQNIYETPRETNSSLDNNNCANVNSTKPGQYSILNAMKAYKYKTPLKTEENRDELYLNSAKFKSKTNDSLLLTKAKDSCKKSYTTPNKDSDLRTQIRNTALAAKSKLDNRNENKLVLNAIQEQANENALPAEKDKINNLPRVPHIPGSSEVVTHFPIMPLSKDSFVGTCLIVQRRKYLIGNKLGEGGSCKVYEGFDVERSQPCAVKCVNLAVDPATAKGYLSEIEMLAKLQTNNYVIRMFACEQINDKLYVIMEKGEMDLAHLIETSKNNLYVEMIIYYWIEMLLAVKCIHDNGVIHSDLKPANFLLVKGRLKLIDFGIASMVVGDSTSIIKNTQAGTISYISPEALIDTRDVSSNSPSVKINIGYRSDVWSLGCILYKFVYGKTPFHHITNKWAKLAAITNCKHKIDFPPNENIPPKLMETLKRCLTFEMRRRPTVEDLLKIKYICYD